jgi:hypothetical protein
MMRTSADDAAWVTRCQATTERLRLREAAAKAGASAQEVAGPSDAVRGPEPAEAVPGDARPKVPGAGGLEVGSIAMTQVTIEATKAETSVHDAGRADVEKSREVAEALPEAGQEAVQPESQPAREEPQPQQDRPMEQAIKAERGVVMPPSIIQAVVPIVETPAPPQGSTSAVIDLTVDDPPSDKGKQKADVETINAPDQAGTSVALGDDLAEASARWPDYTGLALVRAEVELPRWGRSTLEFRDTSNPSAEPFFALNDNDDVQHWEFI